LVDEIATAFLEGRLEERGGEKERGVRE